MKKIIILGILVTLLIASSNGLAKDGLVLTDESYGIVLFGSKLKEAEKTFGEKGERQTKA